MNDNDIVIIAAKRTPIGAMLGQFANLTAPELGAIAHRAAIEQAQLTPNDIDEVISGCVLQAGIGQAPARQAAIFANIPYQSGAVTINKMCGSGMKSVMFAHDVLKSNPHQIMLASGMESMSNAPYLLNKARAGYRLGHGELMDHMFLDGLEDAYDKGKLMGYFADLTAKEFNISRALQDEYAKESMGRALNAQKTNAFLAEIAPVIIQQKTQDMTIAHDECPSSEKIDKISRLKPAFQADGTITAGNSSAISDGAASLILTTYANARQRGLTPLAKIVAHSTYAQEPQWFTTAPVGAIKDVLKKANWQVDDVDLYEINEAFAVVAMVAIEQLALDSKRVNIHGGACALGHPIGASGARIIVTLLYALQRQQKKRGIAALCIGGGEATALAIERL